MESATTTTSSNAFDSHPLPHQQFSSRIAFGNSKTNDNNITKVRLNSLSIKKSTRLPPIARYDSVCSPPIAHEYISYLNRSTDSRNSFEETESNNGLDPNLRVKQLEQNIKFVKEDCQHILESLYQELEDLKIKNRDLQFQLITKGSFTPQSAQSLSKEQVIIMPLIRGNIDPQMGEYITRLENEVKRLRIALTESQKINALLKQELEKQKNNSKQSNEVLNNNPLFSPTFGDFNKTFEEINKTLNSIESSHNFPRITKNVSNN